MRALIRGDAGLYAKADWLRREQIGGDGNPTTMASEPVLETLSERELQVLRHLAGFLTTEENAVVKPIHPKAIPVIPNDR